MSLAYHVDGPVEVRIRLQGVALGVVLGHTEDGVSVSEEERVEPVRSDVAGTMIPADLQKMGTDATITIPLVAWNPAVLDTILNISPVGAAPNAVGKGGARGLLMMSNNLYYELGLTSLSPETGPEIGQHRRFFFCITRGSRDFKMSSKYTVHTIKVYAFVPTLAGVNSTAANVFMDYTQIPLV